MKNLFTVILLFIMPAMASAQLELAADYGINTTSGYEARGALSYTFLHAIRAGVGYEAAIININNNKEVANPAKFPYLFVDYVKTIKRSSFSGGFSYGFYKYTNRKLVQQGVGFYVNNVYTIDIPAVRFGYAYRLSKAFSAIAEANYSLLHYNSVSSLGGSDRTYHRYTQPYASLAVGLKYTFPSFASKHSAKS